jgi:tripeptide aminopeptidase
MNNKFDFKGKLLERFLRYVQIDTQSDIHSNSYPSTAKQMTLLNLLATELGELGVEGVQQDEYGYVMATLPSTLNGHHKHDVPTIGFLAHVDTAMEVTGANVKPQVIESYQGGTITLPGDTSQKIDPSDSPALNQAIGHTLVTTDGTTLLGADDKAGISEIMTAVEYLLAHPEIEHGTIAVAFNPDEEIGRGTTYFDIERFGAKYAYTMDGGDVGGLQYETFSADSATVTIQGQSYHPGYCKGIMVNALKLASEFIDRLPKAHLSPETTAEYEGYIHPLRMTGNVEKVTIDFILRDFDEEKLLTYRKFLKNIAQEVNQLDERAKITIEFSESYRNIRQELDKVPHVVDYARQAIQRIGLTPFSEPVRGGTDGARLTQKGLPTPNLFTGGHNYHSRHEWANVDEMVKATQTIIELAKVWGERGEAK